MFCHFLRAAKEPVDSVKNTVPGLDRELQVEGLEWHADPMREVSLLQQPSEALAHSPWITRDRIRIIAVVESQASHRGGHSGRCTFLARVLNSSLTCRCSSVTSIDIIGH